MSLITQCPACATMFRVVPDQLRISEGWVRCGHCDEVFDANAHLQAPVAEPAAQEAPAPLMAQTPYVQGSESERAPLPPAAPYDWGPLAGRDDAEGPQEDPLEGLQQPAQDAPAEEHAARPPYPLEHQSFDPDYSPDSDPFLSNSPQHVPLGQTFAEEPPAAIALPMQAVAPELEPDPVPEPQVRSAFAIPVESLKDDVPLSFMQNSESTPKAAQKSGKLIGALVSLVLFLALGLQFVYQERNHLASGYAALRPALQSACAVLACTIAAPRQIESISIDSSAFNSIKAGVYVLHVTLKNAAVLALESPALELTLTDSQDRALLKRVITASEYADRGTTMGAAAEMTLHIPISVHTGPALEKIAGYKLLAFYP